ncbi:WD domain, G-beta repeat containing protein [Entamoeba histolytica HM-1:IMSS-B]|uniref:WD domain containing protein n=5 Tax=Entamoeba histolytica TaxID=5759 RepID=C4LSH9_ENTH1|nr:WD domain containing protein [Entamoeba histolytica HM-1:IMSS]EMD46652.1 WD domain containing protein [Entamoeba histolytica KU27]EMH75613.1 WD domain, G-beta repeat containing protein [Entamoeba histolytica HM-1:IMSS-B]ENY64952.1 WD domain, G-beta repeat-containing protein [Entamoeba histolytica HM-1:IMSS-A]GAT91384.1 WD domain containing protein [Entamoeba histolytica]EAL52058.1 WD domain containing protein [Entamoeba histolytica HM-1:IMSS]|eukprot:XP_657443.1 WD domain containing protein [Entamoeba histolytica HM-1:IMSS]
MNVYELENIFGVINNSGNICFAPDGISLYSCTGNRIHVTNLQSHVSSVFPVETFRPIKLIAIDSRNSVILVIDETNFGILISVATRTVLSSINFKDDVLCVKFSPDYPLFALGFEKKVEIWRIPVLTRPVSFTLVRQYRSFITNSKIIHIVWRKRRVIVFTDENRGLILTSKGEIKHKIAFWKLPVVACEYVNNHLYIVSPSGVCASYEYNKETKNFEQIEKQLIIPPKNRIHFAAFGGSILAANIDGEINIFETTQFTKLHAYKCDFKYVSLAVSNTGNCIALGNKEYDFLTVYEWKTESYLMKSVGHRTAILSQTISPNGQYIATGDGQGNLNIWMIGSGECIANFNIKQEGDVGEDCAVRGIAFAPNSLSVIGVGGNGKIMVYDLIKKKCYRALHPDTHQLDGIVIEPRDGDIIAAYSSEDAKVFLYSIRTSKLLDVLTGHAGPITDICIHPVTSELATSSWDKTVRCVNFLNDLQTEVIDHPSEVMSISVNSIGTMYVSACRDGYLYLYGCDDKSMIGLIAYRNDLVGGIKLSTTAAPDTLRDGSSYNPTQIMARKEKYVSSVKFLADNDEMVVCGGNSKYVAYYNVISKSLVSKSFVTKDYSYSNIYDFVTSKKLKQNLDKKTKKVIQTKSICVSPAGKTLSILTDAGVQLYTSGNHAFQPYCLSEAITPEAALEHLSNGNFLSAFIFSVHLNDKNLINQSFRSIPMEEIVSVASRIPIALLSRVLEYLTKEVSGLLFHRAVFFTAALLRFHINTLVKPNISLAQTAIPSSSEYLPHLRNLFKALSLTYKKMSTQSQQALALLNMCLQMSHFLIKKESDEIVSGSEKKEEMSESEIEENIKEEKMSEGESQEDSLQENKSNDKSHMSSNDMSEEND